MKDQWWIDKSIQVKWAIYQQQRNNDTLFEIDEGIACYIKGQFVSSSVEWVTLFVNLGILLLCHQMP